MASSSRFRGSLASWAPRSPRSFPEVGRAGKGRNAGKLCYLRAKIRGEVNGLLARAQELPNALQRIVGFDGCIYVDFLMRKSSSAPLRPAEQ